MKRRSINLLLCMGLLSCLVGCTSQLYLDTVLPPKVAVRPEQWKVAVLNQVDPPKLPYKREGKIEAVTAAAALAYEGMLGAISEDNSFVIVHTDSAAYRYATGGLSPQQVQALYQQHPHHLLLVLNKVETWFDKEIESVLEENKTVDKTAHYILFTSATWTMYDSTGTRLDQATVTRSQPYDSRPVLSGLLAIGPSYAGAVESVKDLAWQTGGDYWQRLYP